MQTIPHWTGWSYLFCIFQSLQYKTNKLQKEEDDDNDEEDNHINETPETPPPATNLEKTVRTSTSALNRKRKAWKMGKVGGASEPHVFKRTYKEPDKDQCTLYSELLAKKLRALDEKTRDFAMLEIHNIMFRLKYQNSDSDLSPCAHHSCLPWKNLA